MNTIIDFLEKCNERVGELVSWLTVLMILAISIDVVLRYVFQFTYIWMVELEIYFFGMLFLLASGYTFRFDKHVRVDVFYAKCTERQQAWINLIGGALFLIPWCYVVIVSSWYYGLVSLMIGEGSPQTGGLPALYILKFCITIGFGFLGLQGITNMLKSLQLLLKPSN